MLKIREWGERRNKVIKPLCKTINENPKCHRHIPQPSKGIHVYTSSSKTSWKKKDVKERDPKGTPKTLMPQIWVHKLDGGENLEAILKETKQHNCRVESQNLPSLNGKKNDEKNSLFVF